MSKRTSNFTSLVKQASNDEEITFTGTVGAYLSKHFSTQKYHLLTWSKTERSCDVLKDS